MGALICDTEGFTFVCQDQLNNNLINWDSHLIFGIYSQHLVRDRDAYYDRKPNILVFLLVATVKGGLGR